MNIDVDPRIMSERIILFDEMNSLLYYTVYSLLPSVSALTAADEHHSKCVSEHQEAVGS
jgi:hypothetical protein